MREVCERNDIHARGEPPSNARAELNKMVPYLLEIKPGGLKQITTTVLEALPQLTVVDVSGYILNCLCLSVLECLCPTFRGLTLSQQELVGALFRQHVLLPLAGASPAAVARLSDIEFLMDEEVELLESLLQVRVLVIDSRGFVRVTPSRNRDLTLQEAAKPGDPQTPSWNWPWIVLYNNLDRRYGQGYHFRSVCETVADRYIWQPGAIVPAALQSLRLAS